MRSYTATSACRQRSLGRRCCESASSSKDIITKLWKRSLLSSISSATRASAIVAYNNRKREAGGISHAKIWRSLTTRTGGGASSKRPKKEVVAVRTLLVASSVVLLRSVVSKKYRRRRCCCIVAVQSAARSFRPSVSRLCAAAKALRIMARAHTAAKLLLCLLTLGALGAHTAMAIECDAECARLVGTARAEAKAAASACSSAQERLTGQLSALKKEQVISAEALALSIQSLAVAQADLQRLANTWVPPALARALMPLLERGQSLLAGAVGALQEQLALANSNSNLAKSTFYGSALQDVYARALAAVRRGVAAAETYVVTLGASVHTTGMSRLAAQLPSIDTSRLRTQAAQAVAQTSEVLFSRVAPLAVRRCSA